MAKINSLSGIALSGLFTSAVDLSCSIDYFQFRQAQNTNQAVSNNHGVTIASRTVQDDYRILANFKISNHIIFGEMYEYNILRSISALRKFRYGTKNSLYDH